MSDRELRLDGKRVYVLVSRAIPGAAARFDGPYSLERAYAERERRLVSWPEARASIFHLARDVPRRPAPSGPPGEERTE